MAFALTFDDGPGPSTQPLLEVLRRHGTRAAFFLIGENLAAPDGDSIAIQLLKEKHIVGNHTMSHDARLELRSLREEIGECDRLIASLYEKAGNKAPNPIPFRLPFGIRTFVAERIESGRRVPAAALDNRLQVLASMGRTHVHWTTILRDWEMETSSDIDLLLKSAISHIEEMEKAGLDAVFALHDGSPRDEKGSIESRALTVELVDRLLTHASEKGWTRFQAPVA